jgi:ribonuclease HI
VGSNNTAELSGFAAALRWLLVEGGGDSAVIRADSQYAGNLACGAWKAKANRELVAHVQALWDAVSELRTLTWEHVKAHRGHRWNERADHLALRKAQGEIPIPLSFWKPGQR